MQSKSLTYERSGQRWRYRYRAVTDLGTGVHSVDYVDLRACLKLVAKIKSTWPSAEIQRVRELLHEDNSVRARQYELKRNGKWVPESRVLESESERGTT